MQTLKEFLKEYPDCEQKVVDGCVFVKARTGLRHMYFKNGEQAFLRIITCVFDKDGHPLHDTFESREQAEKEVARLKEQGKEAIIGDVAPDASYGNSQQARYPHGASVFIVSEKNSESDLGQEK